MPVRAAMPCATLALPGHSDGLALVEGGKESWEGGKRVPGDGENENELLCHGEEEGARW